jgi:fatty-acid desaturase
MDWWWSIDWNMSSGEDKKIHYVWLKPETDLLLRPTNAQYINSNVYFVKYPNMFLCIYIIFRESFLIYANVTKSIILINLKLLQIISRL